MVHPTLTSLAKHINIDERRIMYIIENSHTFNNFYNQLKSISPNIVASDCLDAWSVHWEMYSES